MDMPLSVFSSHQCIICADQCCFSAWFSHSSAWMHSYQIKPALTDSDLPAAPQHIYRPTPGSQGPPLPSPAPLLQSFFWHFSSFCHLRGPAERWGASVTQVGVAQKSLQSLMFTIHKGAEYFLKPCQHIFHEKDLHFFSYSRMVLCSLDSSSPVFLLIYFYFYFSVYPKLIPHYQICISIEEVLKILIYLFSVVLYFLFKFFKVYLFIYLLFKKYN